MEKTSKDFKDVLADLEKLGEEIGVTIRCQRAEIFEKMQKIIEDSKEGLTTSESRRAAAIKKIVDMAEKRGIKLPKGIAPERMFIAVAKYEIAQAEKTPGYIIPESRPDPTQVIGKGRDTLGLTQEEIDDPDTIVDLLNNMNSSGQR